MSCSRARRELLDLYRDGRPDELSAPHLRHLQECNACRREFGLDRALVRQLQSALRARVDGRAPSDGAWASVKRRAELEGRGRRVAWSNTAWRPLLHRTARGVGVAAVASAASLGLLFGGAAPVAAPQSSPVAVAVERTPRAALPASVVQRAPISAVEPDAATLRVSKGVVLLAGGASQPEREPRVALTRKPRDPDKSGWFSPGGDGPEVAPPQVSPPEAEAAVALAEYSVRRMPPS